MTANVHLASYMEKAGLKQSELADRLNARIGELTGTQGKLQDRHVRNWLTGKTRWPQKRQRLALEAEFGVSAEELGFAPRAPQKGATPDTSSSPLVPATHEPPEDPVRRRTFTTSAASIGVAALLPAAPASARPRVGMADVDRLEQEFAKLVAKDNADGGTVKLETRALAFAHHAMERQAVGTATQRVRSRLYQLAAAFTGTALWAAVDAHQSERAQRHLERALHLARLSGNPEVELRLWGHAALLASQRRSMHEAVAAAERARSSSACRRDALYRSLAAARLAGVTAQAGDSKVALRALDNARLAFDRADPAAARPAWIGFYDAAELEGLSALVMARIGRHGEAEAHLHRTLFALRPDYQRNRTYYTVILALSQLRQGEAEQACATALTALSEQPSDSLGGRTGRLIAQFDREVAAAAPAAQFVHEWTARYTQREGQHL
ncbi:hypothetical protein [Streptomyces sp. NRRL S-118]|uniref:hypothetical protein n=1 Tax=Streptomyces sp. NRRL S-118 TaxID=1463881 RepID=UPI0004CB819E|nr:hypothetical protein [Streptomyces sp. NRRL S-118]